MHIENSYILCSMVVCYFRTLHCFYPQRFHELTTPSLDLPKMKREQEKPQAIFAADGETLRQRSTPTKDGYFPVSEKESHC